jgi:hypothetical protein
MSDLEDNDDEKSDDSGSEPLRWYVFLMNHAVKYIRNNIKC